MNIIKLPDMDFDQSKSIILDNIKNTEIIFIYTGNDKLYNYIDNLGKQISSKFLCRLKICKEVDPIDVTLFCNGNKSDFSKLSDLLEYIDVCKQQEVVVKGDLNTGDDKIIKVRTQLSDIVQQFVYLNISLDKIQIMTEKEHIDNEKVKRFSENIKKHERNLSESIKLLSQDKFDAYKEKADEVMASLEHIREYLKDAQDNELKIATAASKKSGKSVIVNSMLKCELAPTSLELATPNNCIYRRSDEGYTLEYNEESKKFFSSEKDIKKYIFDIFKKAEMNKSSGYAVPDMNIGYVPVNEGLSTYTIYDTPGPDLAGADGHKKAAYKAIEEADVIIFAIDYAKYLTDTELDYLKKIRTKFAENNKYYSLIIDVNKLDCRYGNEGDKNSVRILDFIRNKLISVAPEFRDAIVIGTSALTYFDCIEIEKIEESANLGKEGNFREDLEDLIENFSDELEKSEEVNAMQFINVMISNIRTFDGVKIKNIEQIKKHSGMPNLLSYVKYIAQNKAKVEKVNNLLFKIDEEYAKIQNLFLFQQLEESLAENQDLLCKAKIVLSAFSKDISNIYNENNHDVSEMRSSKDSEMRFESMTLNKVGDRNPFKIESIFEFCKSYYIENLLNPLNIIKHVTDEIIRTELQLKIKELFKNSTTERTIHGKKKTVVPENLLTDCIIKVCNSLGVETEKYTKAQLSDLYKKLADENNYIKNDLAKLVNNRLKHLKNAIEKCKSSLHEECGINFELATPEFSYSFRGDTGKIENLDIFISLEALRGDVVKEITNQEKEDVIKDDFVHKVLDDIFGFFKKDIQKYNRIAYDEEYIINELYDNNIRFEIKKHLEKAKIEKSYEKYRNDIENSLRGFVDYIKKEMEEHQSKAISYCDKVKDLIDHTSEYESNINNIMKKQKTLEIIHKSVGLFLDDWGSERY